MAASKEDIKFIASLSRINFTEEEQDEFFINFNKVLNSVEEIKNTDTEGINPTTNLFDLNNVLRDDVVKPSLNPEYLLKNAPSKEGTAYLVPKVVE